LSGERWSMKRTPSRWSTSCWRTREESPLPETRIGSAAGSNASTVTREGRATTSLTPGMLRHPSGIPVLLLARLDDARVHQGHPRIDRPSMPHVGHEARAWRPRPGARPGRPLGVRHRLEHVGHEGSWRSGRTPPPPRPSVAAPGPRAGRSLESPWFLPGSGAPRSRVVRLRSGPRPCPRAWPDLAPFDHDPRVLDPSSRSSVGPDHMEDRPDDPAGRDDLVPLLEARRSWPGDAPAPSSAAG
jgi:hypothetical protein